MPAEAQPEYGIPPKQNEQATDRHQANQRLIKTTIHIKKVLKNIKEISESSFNKKDQTIQYLEEIQFSQIIVFHKYLGWVFQAT